MYKLNGKADRLQAVVGLDDESPDGSSGRFKVLVENYFGGKAIYDSGKKCYPIDAIRCCLSYSLRSSKCGT